MSSVRGRCKLYSHWVKAAKALGVFRAGQRVGVAVSGGPDSVLLFHFMRDLAAELGITLAVVHFNHHLRGAESDADEAFVRQLADSSGTAFLAGAAEVRRVARQKKQNLEAAARELRYRFFFSLVEQGRLDLVVTAHTANDQAETVLMRFLRGAGTRGLSGIHAVLEGKVVRPFLAVRRAEVMRELAARRLEYRIDSTNLDSRLRRNKIRHELLPLLEREFNPGILRLLVEHAARSRDDEAFLEQQARELSRSGRRREGNEEKILLRALLGWLPAIQRRVLRQMLESLPWPCATSYAHLEELVQFAAGAQSGRSLMLPGGVRARREFDWLVLASPAPPAYVYAFPVAVPAEFSIPPLGIAFRFKIIEPPPAPQEYNKLSMSVMDAQKLPGKLLLRNWCAGDRFSPADIQHALKLKELFRRRRIPFSQRRMWPVLECRGQIVWVRGFPPAASVAVSPECGRVLLIEEVPCPDLILSARPAAGAPSI